MKRNSVINAVLILAVIALAVYFFNSLSYLLFQIRRRQKSISSRQSDGVTQDIEPWTGSSGGMRLVLEIDRSKLEKADDKDVLDRALYNYRKQDKCTRCCRAIYSEAG